MVTRSSAGRRRLFTVVEETLAAATRIPARMLGLENEIGTVEVRKRADLVVLRKDPPRDLRNLRAIRWTIKDGIAKTPAEWLAD